MSYAPPPPMPLDLTTKEGRFAKKLRGFFIYEGNQYHEQTPPEVWAELEADIRAVCEVFGQDYEGYVLHLAVYANDNWGFDAENWRKAVLYYLHASSVKPRTPDQLRKLDKKYPMTPTLGRSRRGGLLSDLFGF
jgi:hypothetical protein